MRIPYPFAAVCAWICANVWTCASGQLPTPELWDLTRLGCPWSAPTISVDQAIGAQLFNATGYFHPSDLATAAATPGVRDGIYTIRARNELGLSNSRNILLSSSPWEIAPSNESRTTPCVMVPGTYWQDECPDRGRNYYRVRLDADQTIQLKSLSYALDSRARLVISIQSPTDVTIATTTATHDRDASLTCLLSANTDYLVTVHDHLYRGGAEFRYAIALMTDGDKIPPKPLVEKWMEIAAGYSNSAAPLHGPIISDLWHPRCRMLRAPIAASTSVVHDESQHANQALKLTWPCVVSGQFDSNADVDAFDIDCAANTDVVAEIVSQRLGESTDSNIVVYRVENAQQPTEKAHRIAENDDLPGVGNGEMRFTIKDSLLSFRTTDQGTYRIAIHDQQRSDRKPTPRYVLELRSPTPGFVLASHLSSPVRDPDQARMVSATLSQGGSAMITTHALRLDGFKDPIELQIHGLPEDIKGGMGAIAADQNLAIMVLWHDDKWATQSPASEVRELRVEGTAMHGEKILSSIAAPLEIKWNAIDTFRSPTAKSVQDLLLTKSATSVCPMTVELGPKEDNSKDPILMTAVRGQPLKIPVRVTRRPGAESPVTLRMHHLATKTSAAEIKLEPNVNEGTLELQIPKDAPLGDYLVGCLCEVSVTANNPDPMAKEKTAKYNLQLPSTNIRLRIGDQP